MLTSRAVWVERLSRGTSQSWAWARRSWRPPLAGVAAGLVLVSGWSIGGAVRAGGWSVSCLAGPCAARVDLSGTPETQMLRLVDAVRANAGCVNVIIDPRLTTAAQSVARDMIFRSSAYEGRTATTAEQISAVGYTGNVDLVTAAGLSEPHKVVGAWLAPQVATTAARALRRCTWRSAGVAYLDAKVGPRFGSGVWVIAFGSQ